MDEEDSGRKAADFAAIQSTAIVLLRLLLTTVAASPPSSLWINENPESRRRTLLRVTQMSYGHLSLERMENAMNPSQVQRALQMSAPALLAFVQRKGLSRAELEVVIADLSAAKRAPGRTRQQGYDDYVHSD